MTSGSRAAAVDRAHPSPAARMLQRKCACGNSTDHQECESCRQKRVQRKPSSPSSPPGAPAIVHDVVSSVGRALDRSTRTFFESRFGHDFGSVRIHDDERAARSARAVDAEAYTVGSHVAFAAGRYTPRTRDGMRLLAHELTHVVQQSRGVSGVQRSSIARPIRLDPEGEGRRPRLEVGRDDDSLEREADRTADLVTSGGYASAQPRAAISVQRQRGRRQAAASTRDVPPRHPAIVGLDEAGPSADLTGGTEDRLAACMQNAGPDTVHCTPARSLRWADFGGRPRGGGFAAETVTSVPDVAMDPARASCLQRILGRSSDETRVFQARMDSRSSWGRPAVKDPTNARATGCAGQAAPCRRWFANPANAGGTFTSTGTPDPHCPASAVAGSVDATSAADCAAIETECTNTAVAESQRVLAHEQGHFNIACEIARKANTALTLGHSLAAIRTAVQRELTAQNRAYDNDTNHGCNPSDQASWESQITQHLPQVSIP